MTLSNYHTHTCYCDGKDRPEELVREAIRLGCPELGFSGHSHLSFDDCCMTVEGTEQYKSEIRRLREQYKDQLRIRLGVEQDYFGDLPTDDYEYVIGSVHYVPKEGRMLAVDSSTSDFDAAVAAHYGGDVYAFAESWGISTSSPSSTRAASALTRPIPAIARRRGRHWRPCWPRR